MSEEWSDPSEVARECCWCGKRIGVESPLYAIGSRIKPGVDISEYEGGAMPIEMATQKKQIFAVVPSADSEAKRSGRDLMFVVCSKQCGNDLKRFLLSEIRLGEMLEGIEGL